MKRKPRTFKELREQRRAGTGFDKGSGCYTCIECGKKTRNTNYGSEADMKLCKKCYQAAEQENAESDGVG